LEKQRQVQDYDVPYCQICLHVLHIYIIYQQYSHYELFRILGENKLRFSCDFEEILRRSHFLLWKILDSSCQKDKV
jgi:hypothetical protein